MIKAAGRLTFAAFALAAVSAAAATSVAVEPQSAKLPRLSGPAMRSAWLQAFQGAPMPRDAAALDQMLAGKQFSALTVRLRDVTNGDDLVLDLNWERARIIDGAGFAVVYSYMYDLWRLGAALPPAAGVDVKQTAGAMFAYGIALVMLDGPRCADPSAPSHRLDQLRSQNLDLTKFIVGQPRAARMLMGTMALEFDQATATLRRSDDVLCGGGLDAINAGLLADGDKPLPEQPSAPGIIGRTFAVSPSPGYQPKFVGEAMWRPKQEAVRATLAATLTRLLTVPGDGVATR